MSSDNDRRERFQSIASEVFVPLQRYVQRRIARSQAEDVLSDVMLTIWRRLDDAPRDRTLPWAYGIARRTLANARRSDQRHLRLVQRLVSEPRVAQIADPTANEPDPEIATALQSLTEDDREIIRLWAWEQLEPREIAPVLDVSVNAATLRLSRAKKRLARELVRQDPGSSGHEVVEGTRNH